MAQASPAAETGAHLPTSRGQSESNCPNRTTNSAKPGAHLEGTGRIDSAGISQQAAVEQAFKLVVDIAKLAEKANERMGVPKPLEKQPSRALRSSLSQNRRSMSRGSSISFPSPASSRVSGHLNPFWQFV